MLPADRPAFLALTPRFYPRVWGGAALAPAQGGVPVGEAWLADGDSVVRGGPHGGRRVADVLEADPAWLGADPAGGFGLLAKILDCQDWLSVQVHPNDAQARALVGPGARGKTEAWHVLDAAPGAELLAGVREGTSAADLAAAIRGGGVLEVLERHRPAVGDTLSIPAGTVHALGPGLLIYEIQQASDTTYRVYDWDRPASAGRALHLEESVRVSDPARRGALTPAGQTGGTGLLVDGDFFRLRGVRAGDSVALGGRYALVTAVEGEPRLEAEDQSLLLTRFDTVLVPAGTETFGVAGTGRVLVAQPR